VVTWIEAVASGDERSNPRSVRFIVSTVKKNIGENGCTVKKNSMKMDALKKTSVKTDAL
jgi:hypothetical protein